MQHTDLATPAASQTIVASSVFLDIVGFSKLPTTTQVKAKERFNAMLRDGLGALGSSRYWVRDLGDGALIICPRSPEHALFIALRVQQAFSTIAAVEGEPNFALRIGLNLGVLKTNPDLEGRPNYLGDGINATQRVMDFAQPGQILASRALVDAIAFLHAEYAAMFVSPRSRQDKHGRTHEVYVVEPSPVTLQRLESELANPDPRPQTPDQMPIGAATASQAAPSGFLEHAVTIIRNWFIPFNALLFTVGLVWGGFQRFGWSGQAAMEFGGVLGVLGALIWLFAKRRSAQFAAMGGLLIAVGCLVSAAGWLAPIAPVDAATEVRGSPAATPPVIDMTASGSVTTAPPNVADTSTSSVSTMHNDPQLAPVTAVSAPSVAAPVTVAPSSRNAAPPEAAHKPSATIAARPAKLATPRDAGNSDRARCTELLNKTALGEVISAAEKRELMQSCR